MHGIMAVVAVLDRSGRLLTLDDQDNLVVRDPTTGRILAMAASNATLRGASDASFSSSNASDLVVDQAAEAVTVARDERPLSEQRERDLDHPPLGPRQLP